jgi:hypothetical protein
MPGRPAEATQVELLSTALSPETLLDPPLQFAASPPRIAATVGMNSQSDVIDHHLLPDEALRGALCRVCGRLGAVAAPKKSNPPPAPPTNERRAIVERMQLRPGKIPATTRTKQLSLRAHELGSLQ